MDQISDIWTEKGRLCFVQADCAKPNSIYHTVILSAISTNERVPIYREAILMSSSPKESESTV